VSVQFCRILLARYIDRFYRTTTYQFRPKNSLISSTALQSLESLPIPAYTSPVQQEPQNPEENNTIPFIPGGGLTRRILNSLPDGWSVPTACLLQFVFEGDNQADANILASVVAKVIGVDGSGIPWKQPSSWREGLFGAPHDQSLYG
jgi:proteasome assembly chaperone 2